MKGYTKIPNDILAESQLTIQARYLLCVLLRHCGKDDWCFPSQATLAQELGYKSARHIRNILGELIRASLVYKKRLGFNRSNNYRVAKSYTTERIATSLPDGNNTSCHLRSSIPLHEGNTIPPNSTYVKGKGKTSHIGFEKTRKILEARGLIPYTRILIKKV